MHREITAQNWFDDVPRDTRKPTLWGIGILLAGGLVFGIWGATAPIAGAVVTSGVFVTTGQNKIIQHLEGGVIRDILVKEGDTVEPGATLISLDETAPKAELRRLTLREARLSALQARLGAEIEDEGQIRFDPSLVKQAASDPEIQALLDSQQQAFIARRNSFDSEVAVLRDGINGLEERVRGSQTQLQSIRDQLRLIEEELASKGQLLASGHIRKSEVLALQRSKASLQGEIGRVSGDIGDTKERISRAMEQINGARKAAVKTSVEQMQDTRGELNDVRERLNTSRRILERINITAPVRGVVVKLRYNTAGGVIEPGKNIMEIVPTRDDLIIEAHIRPQDIEHVRHAQEASVRLTALNRRTTPMLGGKVVYLSADALPSDKGMQAPDSYITRVQLDPITHPDLKDFKPTAGMPAEIYIRTHDRSFFTYLMQPLKDSMSRAFREQ